MPYFVYLLLCADGTLYTGTAANVEKRLLAHNAKKGAKYTRSRLPASVVYEELLSCRSDALKREAAIKRLPRMEKLRRIAANLAASSDALFPPAANEAAFRLSPPARQNSAALRFARLNELTLDHFREMEQMESRAYAREFITPAPLAYAWYQAYPASTVAALRSPNDEIAGFVNLFPLTERADRQMRRGDCLDSALQPSDILPLPPCVPGAAFPARAEDGAPLRLFLSCVAVDTPFYGTRLSDALLYGAMLLYLPYLKRSASVVTDNVTAAGVHFSERLGFTKRFETEHASCMFEADASALLFSLQRNVRFSHSAPATT